MNIKITERPGGWSLWATENGTDAEPSTYTATGRSMEQILALLPVILNDAPPPAPAKTPAIALPLNGSRELTSSGRAVAYLTLYRMLSVLDGWIESAQINHRSMEHSHENIGGECYRQIEPADVRAMVNDVARELGVAEFPTPEVAREDAP